MEQNIINILLIFENKLLREGIKQMIEFIPEYHVVTEENKMEEASNLVETYQPDIVLMDIILPKIKSVPYTKQLIENYPNLKVLILTAQESEVYVDYALKIGVHGYLLIDTDEKTLIKAIKTVNNGDFYLHPRVTHHLVNKYRKAKVENATENPNRNYIENNKPLHILTKRECEILQLLADGKSNRVISEIIPISEKTVKNHVSNILRKMNVNDRTHAVVTAIREGWVVIN